MKGLHLQNMLIRIILSRAKDLAAPLTRKQIKNIYTVRFHSFYLKVRIN